MNHVLRTERLLLRPVTALDLTALVVHWTQPDVRKFLFDGAIMSTGEVTTVIAESRRDFAAAGYGFWVISVRSDADVRSVGYVPGGSAALGNEVLDRGGAPGGSGALGSGDVLGRGGAPGGSGALGSGDVLGRGGAPGGGAALAGTVGLRQLDDLGPEIVYSLAPHVWGNGYATEAAGAVVDYALGILGLPEVLAEVDNGNSASAAVIKRLGLIPFDEVPGLLGPMTRYRKTRFTQ